MRILIAGAGIGGLTAALCLQKSGHSVRIFEQSAQLSEVGAGLQCAANSMQVFDYLGLKQEIEKTSVHPTNVLFRDYKTGKTLHDIELGDGYEDKYRQPYLHIHRADLQRVLLTAALDNDPDCIKLAAIVTDFSQSDSEVSLSFEDGTIATGDCLIGADGIKSAIREKMFGHQKPIFTGNIAWRAVVDASKLPSDWMDRITSNFVGPNKHAVLYYLRNQRMANLVGVVESDAEVVNENFKTAWVEKAPWEELHADFAGWHSSVTSIIGAVDRDQCYRWSLFSLPILDEWSCSRVTLLGDAAHATLPFMASGAAMAIEDARILDRALQQTSSIVDGLQLYQRNRISRTSKVQNMSATLGRFYHIENTALRNLAFKTIGIIGGRKQEFLPIYNANTVALR